jgi:hypothetical protein
MSADQVVDVHQAAVLIKAGVFVHGQKIGITTQGNPVYNAFGTVRVDMRSEMRRS